HWWSTKEDYGFGWLVPAFVAYVVHDRWPRIVAALKACAEPGSPRAGKGGRFLLGLMSYGALLGGAVVFLIGALCRAGAGASYPGTLAISLGAGVLALPLLFLDAPEPVSATPAAKTGILGDARVK